MTAEIVSEPHRRTVLGAFLALSGLVSLPILAVRLPPILDYPNHLARMHVLAELHASAALARYYETAWAPLPNLALDAIVPWLARAIPVEAAMRLTLIVMLIATAGGCLALHRVAFQRWSAWPLFAFLLLYNRMFLWGFLNYLAGLALMLWALVAWMALDRRPLALRLIVGTILATIVYFAHLAAFGCYALALLAFAISPPASTRFAIRSAVGRMWPALLTLLPPAMLFLSSPTSGAATGIGFGNPLRKLDLPVSIFDNYNRVLDGGSFAIVAIAMIVGLTRRGILLHPQLRWSVIALATAFIILPSRLFSASGIDHRLPIAIAFVLVGAADWAGIGRRWRLRIAALAFMLFCVRLAVLTACWIADDAVYVDLFHAFDEIPEGGAVAVAAPAADVRAGRMPLLHFPTLAVVLRDAFVPTLFADPAQQPIRLMPEAARLAAEDEPAALWQAIARGSLPPLPGYDDLMIVRPPPSLFDTDLPGQRIVNTPWLVVIRLPKTDRSGSQ